MLSFMKDTASGPTARDPVRRSRRYVRHSAFMPMDRGHLAKCENTPTYRSRGDRLAGVAGHAELGQLDEAWRCIGEALSIIETAKERWFEAEVNRIAGEIALKSPEPDAAKPEAYFDRALAVARQQQAKSWELRAAMSMARLWRDQGKREEARELLAPVYGWFTEGFDTLDLREAKALLDELA
jgi:hypothetical protein